LKEEKLDVVLANRNSPNQGILSGSNENIRPPCRRPPAKPINTAPCVCPSRPPSTAVWWKARAKPFAAALQSVPFHPNRKQSVYSNTTGAPYPTAPDEIRALLGDHLRNPVNFIGDSRKPCTPMTIEFSYRSRPQNRSYRSGARYPQGP
jgi:acyl transferase domain-containing protein